MRRKQTVAAIELLEDRLSAIGFMVASKALSPREIAGVDIEATLVELIVGFANDSENIRLFGPALAWVREHGSAVIIEKLTKLLDSRGRGGSDVEFSGLLARFAIGEGHKRWQSLLRFAPKTPRIVGPADIAPSLLKLRGAEDWASEVGFLVPRGSLDVKAKWTISRAILARLNQQYRNRLIYGAQWRADIITAVERGARTPTEASRASGASYEPCHRVLGELAAAGILNNRARLS